MYLEKFSNNTYWWANENITLGLWANQRTDFNRTREVHKITLSMRLYINFWSITWFSLHVVVIVLNYRKSASYRAQCVSVRGKLSITSGKSLKKSKFNFAKMAHFRTSLKLRGFHFGHSLYTRKNLRDKPIKSIRILLKNLTEKISSDSENSSGGDFP